MKPAILLLLTSFLLGACKKENSSSRTYLLTSKNWRIVADTRTTTVNGQPTVTDAYATYPACDRDDFYKFNADNSVVRHQGALKCNTNAPQTLSGPWSFSSAQTQLSFLPLGYATQACDIIELSDSKLHLRIKPATYGFSNAPDPAIDIVYAAF